MDREILKKRIRRNRRIAFWQNCLKVAICVSAALAVSAVIWTIARPFIRQTEWGAAMAAAGEETAEQAGLLDPENPDGSGQAGIAALGSGMTVQYETPGWQLNDSGWWYAADDASCYINGWMEIDGKQYHFDSSGYMDTGWKAIGGQGCYFSEDGVYDPVADNTKMVALTFDDGPSEYTSRLLDILEANGAKATFLMLGEHVEQYGAEVIPRMAQMGCTIGSHSYDHPNLAQEGAAVAQDQFARTDQAIAQYNNGEGAEVVRFPFGSYTKEEAADTGRPCLYWDVDTLDWKSKNADAVYEAVTSTIEGGNIILMHDIHPTTIDACERLIPDLVSQGWQLVTVEELAASRGYELKPGVTYFGFTESAIANGSVTDENRTDIG